MGRFEKIIGYEAIKEELSIALDVMQNPEKYRKLGVKSPNGILLNGVPGVGKTLFAREFIAESGRKSYTIRKNKPNGAFVDYIRETFQKAAEDSPSIVFLDDMDKFANEDGDHPNAEEYVTVQACMDETKDQDVLVFATTNDLDALPESLKRSGRFDWIFTLEVPVNEDAEKIIAYYLRDKKIEENIDVVELSRFASGYSCAKLEEVVNDAGLHAGFEGRELISQSDLIQSCLRILFEMRSDTSLVPDKIQREAAIHEAGHAVIAELLYPGSVTFAYISWCKNLKYDGFIRCTFTNGFMYTFEGIETGIMIDMGGKAATEVILGKTDVGTNLDRERAYSTVRTLINDTYSYDCYVYDHETSQANREKRDKAVAVEMDRYYKKVKQLLVQNRKYLDAVIEMLCEKKVVSYKDLEGLSDLRQSA